MLMATEMATAEEALVEEMESKKEAAPKAWQAVGVAVATAGEAEEALVEEAEAKTEAVGGRATWAWTRWQGVCHAPPP